jgi:hypothetical protein
LHVSVTFAFVVCNYYFASGGKIFKLSYFCLTKKTKVLIELFQKFAEYEAEPHFNAKASAFASVLQNREALLLDFGQSQYFPTVGKYCALSPLC